MRLTSYQIKVLKTTAREIFGDRVTVLLFGSRTDDKRRGGDIDLYITDHNCTIEKQLDAKLKFLVKVKQKIGEQKIDVIFAPLSSQPLKPIHQIAKRTGIPI